MKFVLLQVDKNAAQVLDDEVVECSLKSRRVVLVDGNTAEYERVRVRSMSA